ncbi:hypothetical protein GCM10010519_59570 [Streptomyces lactacystinicus]
MVAVAGALPCAGAATVAAAVPDVGGASVADAPGAAEGSDDAAAVVAVVAVVAVATVVFGPAGEAAAPVRTAPQRRSTVVVAAADSVSLRTVTWRVPSGSTVLRQW